MNEVIDKMIAILEIQSERIINLEADLNRLREEHALDIADRIVNNSSNFKVVRKGIKE